MLRRTKYFGTSYHCNICNSNVRLLKTIGIDIPVLSEKQVVGAGKRKAQCPVCFSSDRTRLLQLFLSENTMLGHNRVKLLHIAPEAPLRSIFEKQSNIDYLTADLMQEDVDVKMDLTDIQFPRDSFDCILCSHVLEHIPHDAKAMKELFRLLKPGGWAILQVPISNSLEKTFEDFSIQDPGEREKVFGQIDHVRIYGLDYPERLRNAGFEVTVYDWTKDPGLKKNHPEKLGLHPDEKVFFCKK